MKPDTNHAKRIQPVHGVNCHVVNKKKKRDTPITDGDARPDRSQDAGNEPHGKNEEKAGQGKKFETERLRDINSMEDYKDLQGCPDRHVIFMVAAND